MPAVSVAQRKLVAMREHNPGAIYARNRGILGMKMSDAHDFASTPEQGLPEHVQKKGGALRRAALGEK